MNLGSRLMTAGLSVGFVDLNLESFEDAFQKVRDADYIGIGIVGPPHVPGVIEFIRRVRRRGCVQPILLGGEGIARVSAADFSAWFDFDRQTSQVRDDAAMCQLLGFESSALPSMYLASAVPMLRLLDKDSLRRYLTAEFCFFVSQGCTFNCDFCVAQNGRPEQYRNISILLAETEFICEQLRGWGGVEFRAYLSNLDSLQTPEILETVLQGIKEVAERYGVRPRIRCLATSRSTFRAHQADPGRLSRLRRYGLEAVGIGVDGSEEVWRRQNKRHNSASELETVISVLREAEIIAELLMVVGFPGTSARAMFQDAVYSIRQAMSGNVIRPYMAKVVFPGGNGWLHGHPAVRYFRKHPEKLGLLDFAAVATRWTHPKLLERCMANLVYLSIITALVPFGRCLTRPVFPRGILGSVGRLVFSWMPPGR